MPHGMNLRENSIFLELQASDAGHLIQDQLTTQLTL